MQISTVPITVWQGADGKSDSTNCVYTWGTQKFPELLKKNI